MSHSPFIDNGALSLLSLVSKIPEKRVIEYTKEVLSEIARAEAGGQSQTKTTEYDNRKDGGHNRDAASALSEENNMSNNVDSPQKRQISIGNDSSKRAAVREDSSESTTNEVALDSDSEEIILFKGRARSTTSGTIAAATRPANAVKIPQSASRNNPGTNENSVRKWRNRLSLLELAKCLVEGDARTVVASIAGASGFMQNDFTPNWIVEGRSATKEETTKDRNLWVHKIFDDKKINDWALQIDVFRKERRERLGDGDNDEEASLEEWKTIRGGLKKVQNLENELTRVATEISLRQVK